MRKNGQIKDNSRKSGDAFRKKLRKRKEAEERNSKYQKLSIEEKLSRNSIKVKNKLIKK